VRLTFDKESFKHYYKLLELFNHFCIDLANPGLGRTAKVTHSSFVQMGLTIRSAVRARYYSAVQDESLIARLAKQQGKAAGAELPARQPAPRWVNRGYIYLGQAVTSKTTRRKHESTMDIGIRPSALDWRGYPLWIIAKNLEDPPPMIVMRRTLRMHIYIEMLKKHWAGPGKPKTGKHLPDMDVGPPIVFHPQPVPIWRSVFEDLGWKHEAFKKFNIELSLKLNGVARRYGARITPMKELFG